MVSSISAIIGFLVTFLIGFVFIPFLKKLNFGQTILEIGPAWHKEKQGTPIMGGLMFILGTVIATIVGFIIAYYTYSAGDKFLYYIGEDKLIRLVSGLLMALLMSSIGFMDDYIKAVKKQNLGLKASQKTAMQLLVSAAYLVTLYLSGMTTTTIPFVGDVSIVSGFGLVFWPIALMFIYGFTNAVNLTDGVDGLASSVTVVVSLFFMGAGALVNGINSTILPSALCGALIGFLVWNLHPAKVFMGDTGSMFLGGIVVAFSFEINCPVILILAGVLYLFEALSVVIQVTYFKLTGGKRIFKMSPIHHHFEMSGWKENKIVVVFSLVAAIGCVLSFLLLKTIY